MELSQNNPPALVSVIIPCYNHGHYLKKAIESVLHQTYPHFEIIVVNDGSTDNTHLVATEYSEVRHIFQQNQGLSAARNTGILNSTGEYIVFLDADDCLFPEALDIQINYLLKDEGLAMVSGAYKMIIVDTNEIKEKVIDIYSNHYNYLLQGNFIAVPASVMFRKWVCEEFKFDVTLKACEDYDYYLRITRNYSGIHHSSVIAAYYKHQSNMSNNNTMMLNAALKVLKKQKKILKSSREHKAYRKGMIFWKNAYCTDLYIKLKLKQIPLSKVDLFTLFKYKPIFLIKLLVHKSIGRYYGG